MNQNIFDTYNSAFEALPNGSTWSCSFGYKGQGGFAEYWNAPNGEKHIIRNGRWDDKAPFVWTLEKAE